jgi:hypothetical protein
MKYSALNTGDLYTILCNEKTAEDKRKFSFLSASTNTPDYANYRDSTNEFPCSKDYVRKSGLYKFSKNLVATSKFLKILGARMTKGSKFHTEDPEIQARPMYCTSRVICRFPLCACEIIHILTCGGRVGLQLIIL